MAIRERMIKRIQKLTGDSNAGLWTLSFNEEDANVSIDSIGFRGVAGNIRMQEGKIRTNTDVERDSRKLSHTNRHK